MAIVRKCDICGKLYEHYEDDTNCMALFTTDEYHGIRTKRVYDMCRGCNKAISDVMTMLMANKEVKLNGNS